MRFGRRENTANRPWRLSAKLLIASSVVTVIGFSAICASVMLDMRHGEEELARRTLDNLASGIDADINRSVELYDLSLRAVVSTRLRPEDTITVLRRDATVIMRTPFDLDLIGRSLAHVPGVMRALSEPSGSYTGLGALDGVPRLLVWRDGTRPLVVLVGKPWSSILSLWRTEATRIGAILTGLISFVLGVTLFLAREIGRRAIAEDKLEELAATDALTGLKNRRKFDAAIDAEWRRAARQETPLALLMIDADHFKRYNDTLVHQAA